MNRKWLLVCAGAFIVGSVVCAYCARQAAQGGLEAAPAVYDVGDIGQGETRDIEFQLTNRFPRRVEVKDVQTSCACTKAEVAKRSLAGGEKTVLRAKWSTGASRGKRTTTLTVFFAPEGGGFGQTTLAIEGNVQPDMLYRPESLEFDKTKAAKQSVAFSAGRIECSVKRVWCPHQCFTADFDERSNTVTVAFDPTKWTVEDDQLPLADARILNVETTSPHEPILQIPLMLRRGESNP
ncbi:MAG TPA: hypothetical protein DDY78_21205 [Planctomycetales bacterium]|jgi:hypothetical protein|nr:hypothetical protein [Planctomycetales bacterium]